MPTVAAVLGLAPPAAAHGRNLLDAARRDSASVYSETYYPRIHLGWSELRSLVDARYHLIDGPRPELYDVVRDPAERNDVLSEKPQAAAAMRTALASGVSDFEPPAPATKEERERLMSLGYLAGGAALPAAASALPNPRDRIASYARARAAFGLVEQGKDEQAVRAFDAVLRENPGFVDALTERAAALGRLGRYQDSALAYERAIEKAPELAAPLSLTLARIELEMGDFAKATASARKALAAEPAVAHELLAAIALAGGRLDDAEREAALAVGDPGAEARAAVVAAEVTARRGRPEQALARLEAVRTSSAALGPVPWLEFVRGDTLARLGRHAEAEAALRAEIQAFPSHARAYASLAIVTAMRGRPLAESRRLLEDMNRAAPGAGSRQPRRARARLHRRQRGGRRLAAALRPARGRHALIRAEPGVLLGAGGGVPAVRSRPAGTRAQQPPLVHRAHHGTQRLAEGAERVGRAPVRVGTHLAQHETDPLHLGELAAQRLLGDVRDVAHQLRERPRAPEERPHDQRPERTAQHLDRKLDRGARARQGPRRRARPLGDARTEPRRRHRAQDTGDDLSRTAHHSGSSRVLSAARIVLAAGGLGRAAWSAARTAVPTSGSKAIPGPVSMPRPRRADISPLPCGRPGTSACTTSWATTRPSATPRRCAECRSSVVPARSRSTPTASPTLGTCTQTWSSPSDPLGVAPSTRLAAVVRAGPVQEDDAQLARLRQLARIAVPPAGRDTHAAQQLHDLRLRDRLGSASDPGRIEPDEPRQRRSSEAPLRHGGCGRYVRRGRMGVTGRGRALPQEDLGHRELACGWRGASQQRPESQSKSAARHGVLPGAATAPRLPLHSARDGLYLPPKTPDASGTVA